jgi:hypothetical protein
MRVRKLLVGAAVLVGGTAIALAAAEKVSSRSTALQAKLAAKNLQGLNYNFAEVGFYEKDPITTAVNNILKKPPEARAEIPLSRKTLKNTLYLKPTPAGVTIGDLNCGGWICAATVTYPSPPAFQAFDEGRLGAPGSPLFTWPGGAGRSPLVKKHGALVATWFTYAQPPHRGTP